MTTFQFSELEQGRKKHNALKWNMDCQKNPLHEGHIPMWIADCDFPCDPNVLEKVRERLQHPTFGYTYAPKTLFTSFVSWASRRYVGGDLVDPDLCTVCPSIVTALAHCIRAFSTGSVLINTPIYPPFSALPTAQKQKLLTSTLVRDTDNVYRLDMEDLEAKLKEASVYLLCHPQNPGGCEFPSSDLDKVAELAAKYNVFVVSDEIHGDLSLTEDKHHTFLSFAQKHGTRTASCFSPSKSFNLAGFVTSIIAFSNPDDQGLFNNALQESGIHGVNCLGPVACQAAYDHGHDYLEGVIQKLNDNIDLLVSGLADYTHFIIPIRPKFGFLIWCDCSGISSDPKVINDFFNNCGIAVCNSTMFGPGSEIFVRLNIGCRKELVVEAIARITGALKKL
ncbi:hypothetical protein GEMRC1_003404 [Eukaryota sp. GEM-RC1]